MKIKEQIARASKDIIYAEIVSISHVMRVESNQEIIDNAMKIASDFLKENSLTEPITLARASFYIAIKDSLELTEEKIQSLVNNNGKTNRWWIYLAPMVERHAKRR